MSPPDIIVIKRTVARAYRVQVSDLEGSSQLARIVEPRHVAMWLCRARTWATFAEIGREFGGRSRATTRHAVRSIANRRQTETNLRVRTDYLDRRICDSLQP